MISKLYRVVFVALIMLAETSANAVDIKVKKWNVPASMTRGKEIPVSILAEASDDTEVLLRLSYRGSLVWSTLLAHYGPYAVWSPQSSELNASFVVCPDWPDGVYELSIVPDSGQQITGVLSVEFRLGDKEKLIPKESVAFSAVDGGWDINFSSPRVEEGFCLLQGYDTNGLLRAVEKVPYKPGALTLMVSAPSGNRWAQISSGIDLKLVFPNTSIPEVKLPFVPAASGGAGVMKPMANGCYREDSGVQHYWYVEDDHTLVWDGAPYIPHGGMFHTFRNTRFSNLYERRKPYQDENKVALDAIQAAGFRDLYVNQDVGLHSPEWYQQSFVDELNQRGIQFGMQLTTGAKPIDAYPIYSSETQGLITGVVGTDHKLVITVPRIHLRSILLVPGANDGPAFEIPLERDLRDKNAVKSEIIQAEISETTETTVKLTLPVNAGINTGKYYALVKERVESKRVSNVWETLAETKKDLEWISRVDWGAGLRFFVDPVCNETGFNNNYEVQRVWSDSFNNEFAGWLKERYAADLDILKERWALPKKSIRSFDEASRLIPLRNTDEARFGTQLLLVDPVSKIVYETTGGLGECYLDYSDAVRELYSYKNDEIARHIKSMVNVPVVLKRVTSWVGLEVINRVPGGIDGLGLELYPKNGSGMAYGGVSGRMEAEACTQTVWFLVTEIGYNSRPDNIEGGWPTKESMRRSLRESASIGAKGYYMFGWKLPVSEWGKEQLYNKPVLLRWVSEIFAEMETNPPKPWSAWGLAFPEGANWWQRSKGVLWNRYNCVYDREPSGFPQSICLWNEEDVQLWAANSRQLFPDVEPVVMSLQDAIYVNRYEKEINRLLEENRRIIYCGFWPDSEKCSGLGRHFSREQKKLSDGSSIQGLNVFDGDQVLAKEGNLVWAKRSSSLLIISRTPVAGGTRNTGDIPLYLRPEWARSFMDDLLRK